MRGSPLVRAFLSFLVIASFGYPLWRLTHKEAVVAPPREVETPGREVPLTLTFIPPPERVALLHLGKLVWSVEKPGAELKKNASLEYPPEGVDLRFQIEWPLGVEHGVMRVQLTGPDNIEHDKTVWGRGKVDKVVTFEP